MSKVMCSCCKHFYNNDNTNECPHCGSKAYYTEQDLKNLTTKRAEREEEWTRAHQEILDSRVSRAKYLVRTMIVAALIAIFVLCISLHNASVNRQINDLVKDAQADITNDNYVEGYKKLNQIEANYGRKAKKKLSKVKANCTDAFIDYVDKLAIGGDYDYIIDMFGEYYNVSADTEVRTKMNGYITDNIVRHLDLYKMPEDLEASLVYLCHVKQSYAQYDFVSEKLNSYIQQYVLEGYRKADEYASVGEYERAIALLESVSVVAQSEGIDKKITYLQSKIEGGNVDNQAGSQNDVTQNTAPIMEDSIVPVKETTHPKKTKNLYDMKPMVNNGLIISGNRTVSTNTGDTYHNTIQCQFCYYMCDATFYLGGKYSEVHGIYAVKNDGYEFSETNDNTFSIYADDVLIYTSPALLATDEPIEFSVDVSGARNIKIYVASGYHMLNNVILLEDI